MASFAKTQLLKYGWTEGKGLGKNENGIVDALKPKLKFDKSGIGQDTKEYKWWESVYDRAAANVKIEKSKESRDISMSVRDSNAVKISMSKFDLEKSEENSSMLYGNFRQTCTLDNGKVVANEDIEKSKIPEEATDITSCGLTDEELFRACGGRTAHKGARHGLTLNGKLARIAMQEARLLGNADKNIIVESNEWTEVKKKKKSKRKSRRSVDEMDSSIFDDSSLVDANSNSILEPIAIAGHSSPEIVTKESKKLKRKEERNFAALTKCLDAFSLIEDSTEKKSTKKRKRKKCEIEGKVGIAGSAKKRKNRNEDKFENSKPRELANELTIELADGNIITLDDDDDNENNFVPEEIRQLPKKRKKDYTEAEKLNNRIDKRKKKCQAKTEKKRVERLSECLMAVNICEDSVDSGRGEDLVLSSPDSRKMKKWKKERHERKKVKKERKIEEITLDS